MEHDPRFKQTEVGLIPEDWDVKELSEISRYINRGIPPKYSTEGFPVLNQKCVRNGKLDLVDIKFHNTKEPFLEEKIVVQDDILVNSTGVGTLGRAANVRNKITKTTLADSHITIIRIDKTKANPWFVSYYLNSIQSKIEDMGEGTSGQLELSRQIIKNINIPFPSINEQSAIAQILSDIDSKIELNQQMNRTFEAIGQAVFKQWFVDFDFPNKEGEPYKSSGGEMVESDELGKEIPKEWKVRTLEEISSNFDSKRVPLSSREREKMHGNYPYYGAAGILDYVNHFIFDGTYVLMGEDGTVIDENGFPILQLVRGEFWVNNHAHVLQGRDISTELLFLLLRNTNIQHIVTGAVQPKINQGNMNTLKFVIPDEDCKSDLQKFVNQLYAKIGMNNEQNQTLSQIRDSLLPKLMSGRIRVPVPQEAVET